MKWKMDMQCRTIYKQPKYLLINDDGTNLDHSLVTLVNSTKKKIARDTNALSEFGRSTVRDINKLFCSMRYKHLTCNGSATILCLSGSNML
jgi:hypothetical protein